MAVGCSITRIKLSTGVGQIYACKHNTGLAKRNYIKANLKRVLGTIFKLAILIRKPILVLPAPSALATPKSVF
jgi:hypothetical protein